MDRWLSSLGVAALVTLIPPMKKVGAVGFPDFRAGVGGGIGKRPGAGAVVVPVVLIGGRPGIGDWPVGAGAGAGAGAGVPAVVEVVLAGAGAGAGADAGAFAVGSPTAGALLPVVGGEDMV